MSKKFSSYAAIHAEARVRRDNPAQLTVSQVTDLDRAWRAVDALGGTWPFAAPMSYEEGYQDGYNTALADATAAIEKLGGRDVPGADQ